MTGLLSIIVPVHNSAGYLTQCVDSVLCQTYQNIEIILVDDRSDDGSAELCSSYADRFENVTVCHCSAGSAGAARNVGLDLAKGEFIAFVDSDDWIAPEMYERLLSVMLGTGASVAMCGANFIHEDGRVEQRCVLTDVPTVSAAYAMSGICISTERKQFTEIMYFYLWDKVYRRTLWDDLRFDESLHNAEDRWVLFQLYQKVDFVALCPHCLYNYRRNIGISSGSEKRQEDDYLVGQRMLRSIRCTGLEITPYVETMAVHVLGRAKECIKSNDKERFRQTVSYYRGIYRDVKNILPRSTVQYRVLCAALRYTPGIFWYISRMARESL